MRLSILEQPAFYHRQKGDFTACEKACAAEEPLAEKEKEEYKEAGMFRLPKGKAISENPKPIVSEWKSPKKVPAAEPFSPTSEAADTSLFLASA